MLQTASLYNLLPQNDSSLDLPVDAADSLIVFAYDCLQREFAALLEQQPQARETPEPATIHRTRIAARRLRVALRMFRKMLPRGAAEMLRAELRWFARSLGEIRDLDVYTEVLRRYAPEPDADGAALKEYTHHVSAARAAARATLPALYGDTRYRALLESLDELTAKGPARAALRRWRPLTVSDGARDLLRKSAKRVVKLGDAIVTGSAARDLHRLRIRAKRLRYALEFFEGAFPALKAAAKAAKQLQDVLGEHQDAVTASARVRRYVRARGKATPALRALRRQHDREAAQSKRRFTAEWRSFKKNVSIDELLELVAP